MRVVPNLYPALAPDARRDPRAGRATPTSSPRAPAIGGHEVIVNNPQAGDLARRASSRPRSPPRWTSGASACARTRDAAYVHVIVNERREAGASLPHTHAQLYALRLRPGRASRASASASAPTRRGRWAGNLLGDLVQEEVRRRERIVAIDDEAVLLSPLRGPAALSSSCSCRGAPRRASRTTARPARRCCTTRSSAWRAGSAPSPPLNLWVRTAPRGADHFCWRIDIVPRLTHLAGLELGTGVHLNIVAPEDAAAELRDA